MAKPILKMTGTREYKCPGCGAVLTYYRYQFGEREADFGEACDCYDCAPPIYQAREFFRIPTPKEPAMKTDYYTVRIPGDVYNTVEELADLAINEARERARIYATPAAWSARLIAGQVGDFEVTFQVTRKRSA